MLRYLFAFILLIHGIIHVTGFAKAVNYGTITQLAKYISKPLGLLWLVTALLFMITMLTFLLKKEIWPYLALIAVAISQFLIITVWQDAKSGTALNTIILFVAIASWASYLFEMGFEADVKRHLAQSNVNNEDKLTELDVASLPTPVQEYIRYTGAINQPKVKNMKIVFDGEMRDKGKDFFKFSSVQYNFFDEPARLFFMKAKMYGSTVPGYHCYENKSATMQVKLLGLFNVVNIKGTAMNKAETVTVFNDMCLMAPATLVDKRIKWASVDSLSAKATFTNGMNKITAILHFNETGELINFTSDDRYEIGEMKQYRFSTPVKKYTQMNGRNMWTYGETIWHYPDGEFVYGKFTVKSIEYNITALE